ncbi:aminotransferase-like domain-containing protein [Gulosibacter chungangensis]|uniref:Aminotransferase class I/II-fold pyridoxal phosphate-dependent enzyme n=1 Tax=Gulosibacter chungangensis TaxID=979746 RepID=A0A7J5B9R8_9MICO|nr:PLP-dependent aminotransferase family protein [Gulosibacter chungangensis]KAB1642576.1 aminotransferase class I/II-fold pyridoxal phosphate-dependent enzyme [Gulosibacter chungangensis]
MRSTSIPEVPIELDRASHLSLPLQLARAVRQLIDDGALLPGDELPSTRAWAARLGVSRGTVVSAYEQLTAEGYLSGERGSATRINSRLRQTHPLRPDASGRGDQAGTGGPGGRAGSGPSTGSGASPGSSAGSNFGSEPSRGVIRFDPAGESLPISTSTTSAQPSPASTNASTRRHGPDAPAIRDTSAPKLSAHQRPDTLRPRARDTDPRRDQHPPSPVDMLPGRPATDWLHTPAWRRAWRNAADAELTSLPPEGDPKFLANVADHFRRMRGLARDPAHFLVTAGGREGLALIIETLASELGGSRKIRVGVESPGYPSLRRTATRLGCTLVPLEVDREGLRTDLLPTGANRPDLAIVTPSHQYPLGGSLPIDRRLEFLEWARREEAFIVEDDYDSELRYVGQPLPTLTALDEPTEGHVALLGTFSTTVAPALGIGMLCVPDRIRERLLATRRDLGTPVSAVVQHAFAEYLESGELRRHTARMRRTYRQRRGLVLEAIGDLEGVTVAPMDGGLHAVVRSDRPEAELLAACEAAGVLVSPGADYWRSPDAAGPASESASGATAAADTAAPAAATGAPIATATGTGTSTPTPSASSIVIGYAHLSESALHEGLTRLRQALGA